MTALLEPGSSSYFSVKFHRRRLRSRADYSQQQDIIRASTYALRLRQLQDRYSSLLLKQDLISLPWHRSFASDPGHFHVRQSPNLNSLATETGLSIANSSRNPQLAGIGSVFPAMEVQIAYSAPARVTSVHLELRL